MVRHTLRSPGYPVAVCIAGQWQYARHLQHLFVHQLQDGRQRTSLQQVQAAVTEALAAALMSPTNMSAALQNGIASRVCAPWSQPLPPATEQSCISSNGPIGLGHQSQHHIPGSSPKEAARQAHAGTAGQKNRLNKALGRSTFAFASTSCQDRPGESVASRLDARQSRVSPNSSSSSPNCQPVNAAPSSCDVTVADPVPLTASSAESSAQDQHQDAEAAGLQTIQPSGSKCAKDKLVGASASSSSGSQSLAQSNSKGPAGSSQKASLDSRKHAACARLLPLMAALADDKAGRVHLAKSLVGNCLGSFLTTLPRLQPGDDSAIPVQPVQFIVRFGHS